MCGITGYWRFSADEPLETAKRRIAAMTASLRHRGPDSGGAWLDPAIGLALGHRRLAIRDLSPAGRQPMAAGPNGAHVVSYNGEIYNADELREELRGRHGVAFRGDSDTETLVHGCAVWGVEATLARLIGMFAFAYWDDAAGTLWLARDRMGIKPLYWEMRDGEFSFASELKALREGWRVGGRGTPAIDRSALALMMRHGYIGAPWSIYEGVGKLPGGCLLRLRRGGEPVVGRYWDPREEFRRGAAEPFRGGEREAVAELEGLLRDSVRRRMVADVPLGAFLSGGIDSSLVCALMRAQTSGRVRTFCIGFEENEFDEAPYARAVAEHLGTTHHELRLGHREVMDIIPAIPDYHDEPFADASQLPTYLLSRMTRERVTVALSGDGGDELFAGYVHYNHDIARVMNLPPWLRHCLRRGVRIAQPAFWDAAVRFLPKRTVPERWRDNFSERLYRRVDGLEGDFLDNVRNLVSIWRSPLELVPGSGDLPGAFGDKALLKDSPGNIATMQYLDSVTFLIDDILVKVDRASMANSLEVRVPLLDHRVYSFAWRLPMSMKMKGDAGKWILRRILGKYLPPSLIDRPKMGFSVPIFAWLRGPLREWAEEALSPAGMAADGWLDAGMVADAWRRLQEGEGIERQLWNVLMFQAWLDASRRARPAPDVDDMEFTVAGAVGH